MMIKVYYRKLYDQPMIDRWNACQFTSFHPHGEPPAWNDLRAAGVVDKAQYTLNAHYNRGISLPSARDLYFACCVIKNKPTPWAALSQADKWATQEQAGVFACDNPATVYWYGGAPDADDRFVVFYGVKLSDGPEANSVVTPVIKVLTPVPLTAAQFVAAHCGGHVPDQPLVDGFKMGENEDAPGLDWGDDASA